MTDEELSVGETFAVLREESKQRRAAYRANAVAILREKGITFRSRNNGAHLIVTHEKRCFDFWPGTGLFKCRPDGGLGQFGISRTCTGRGIFNLLRELGVPQ